VSEPDPCTDAAACGGPSSCLLVRGPETGRIGPARGVRVSPLSPRPMATSDPREDLRGHQDASDKEEVPGSSPGSPIATKAPEPGALCVPGRTRAHAPGTSGSASPSRRTRVLPAALPAPWVDRREQLGAAGRPGPAVVEGEAREWRERLGHAGRQRVGGAQELVVAGSHRRAVKARSPCRTPPNPRPPSEKGQTAF
jgi:hypothetical protein